MTYDEFINSPIFSMTLFPKRSVHIRKMNNLMADMIWQKRIEIWHKLDTNLQDNGSLMTNSTPKLRKMMRRV